MSIATAETEGSTTGRAGGLARLTGLVSVALVVDAVAVAVFAALSVHRGQDINFDQLSYHYWYAELFVKGQLSVSDPAMFSGRYQNPLVDVPFYLLSSTLPPRWCGAALGALYGVAFVLVRRIAARILPGTSTLWSLLISGAAAALGATSAIGWSELGTSFSDLIVSLAVLGGMLLWVDPAQTVWRRLGIGLLLGAAVGLKLTAGPFAVAMFVALALRRIEGVSRLRVLAEYCGAAAVGLAVPEGWWAWHLESHFGSPVFPLFNSVFKSDLIPHVTAIGDPRFGPTSLIDLVKYPVYMARGTTRTTEVLLRDQRWLLICALVVVCGGAWITRRYADRGIVRRSGEGRGQTQTVGPGSGAEFTLPIMAFFAISWLLWAMTFSISRYLLPAELSMGVLAIVLLRYLAGLDKGLILGVLATALAVCIPSTAVPDWGHKPWTSAWYGTDSTPYRSLPAGSVVLTFVDVSPLTYALAPLSPDTKGIVVTTGYFGSGLETRARVAIANATQIWVLRDDSPIDALVTTFGLNVADTGCRPVANQVKPAARLCRASIVGAG